MIVFSALIIVIDNGLCFSCYAVASVRRPIFLEPFLELSKCLLSPSFVVVCYILCVFVCLGVVSARKEIQSFSNQPQNQFQGEGVQFKSLGVRQLTYKLMFLACSITPTEYTVSFRQCRQDASKMRERERERKRDVQCFSAYNEMK